MAGKRGRPPRAALTSHEALSPVIVDTFKANSAVQATADGLIDRLTSYAHQLAMRGNFEHAQVTNVALLRLGELRNVLGPLQGIAQTELESEINRLIELL